MSFYFAKPVDPQNPLNPYDQAPDEWESIDTHDYRKALFGSPCTLFTQCVEWEKRELARHKAVS